MQSVLPKCATTFKLCESKCKIMIVVGAVLQCHEKFCQHFLYLVTDRRLFSSTLFYSVFKNFEQRDKNEQNKR